MVEKNINNVRIVNKHDTEENWLKATGFTPKQGELIVYDIDNNYSYERIKIGDGVQNVNALPFIDDSYVSVHQQTLTEAQKEQARTNIGAVSMEEVEELMGIEEEFSETGNPLVLNLDEEKEIEVISKISRQESSPYYESTKLTLHWANSEAIINAASMYGGPGTVIEKNGLTMTVNDDGTATFKGTSTASTLFDATIPKPKVIYPAGSYLVPSSGMMMQPFDLNGGSLGNKWGRGIFAIDQSFILNRVRIEYKADQTVDETKQINISLANIESNSDNSYAQTEYTVDFGKVVTEGEYNWTTGELKDADGNTVSYHGGQQIIGAAGMNIFWTGFGEVTASNRANNLEKVVIRLGEVAPEETVPSICDFTLTPTTPQAGYYLHDKKVIPGGTAEFFGQEIPLITTKGTLAVVDSQGEVTTEKYVDTLINWQGATDLLTNRGIHKVWSDKFYFTKEPVAQEDFSYDSGVANALYTFEFTEEDFQNTGLPAKLDNIPIVSPCFYTGADAASKLNARVWGGHIFPATLSWDSTSGKYIFKVRGLWPGEIMAQLTNYSKGYFHYQLETPYDVATTVALGISSGDTVTFTVDDSEWKTYLDGGLYIDSSATAITTVDATPTGFVYIPRNAVDACDGMINAARMLNTAGSAGGDATVQGYSWIGEGDGSTDYTSKIQSKLDVLHSVSDGGTVYLGPGTYPISGSLIVYSNTRIIGDGQTVIKQTADNTHALILSGSYITIKDLTVRLSGACTALTACMYVNSYNHPNYPKYDSTLPENIYAQGITVENVFMTGAYRFDRVNGYDVVSDAYENYKGVGICSGAKLFFNYAHMDNIHAKHLMAGIYNAGGANYFNITAEFCKYGSYSIGSGNNTYFISGHSYYSTDEHGKYISMSDAIAYAEGETFSTYHLRVYDSQAYKNLMFLGSRTESNKIDIQISLSTQHGLWQDHAWNLLKWYIIDYGRGNTYNDNYKHTPFHIGSSTTTIAGAEQSELSNPVIQNALSGAGVWGNISANAEFVDNGISLRDVCRYPSEKKAHSNKLPYIVSKTSPSADAPIEIVIDYSNRPVIGLPNYFIQFCHDYVASDYVVYFDTTNTGVFNEDFVYPVTGNTNVIEYFDYPQIGYVYKTYRMKIRFTKPLQLTGMTNIINGETFDYNPEGLIGICNIGMTVNDYAGRSFLGECGGSLYGNVDMHQNTLKNLPDPVDAGDAVSKEYLHNTTQEYVDNAMAALQTITATDDGTGIITLSFSSLPKVEETEF